MHFLNKKKVMRVFMVIVLLVTTVINSDIEPSSNDSMVTDITLENTQAEDIVAGVSLLIYNSMQETISVEQSDIVLVAESFDNYESAVNETSEVKENTKEDNGEEESSEELNEKINKDETDNDSIDKDTKSKSDKKKSEKEKDGVKNDEGADTKETTSTYTDEEYEILAHLLYAEAGAESDKCMYYVGSVVLNRVNSSKYPNTIKDVVYQKGQYYPARHGFMNRKVRNQRCYDIAKELLDNGSIIPEGVLGQASYSIYKKYGSKLYEKVDGEYFFYVK